MTAKRVKRLTRREFERRCNYEELEFIEGREWGVYVFYRWNPSRFMAEVIGKYNINDIRAMSDEEIDRLILELKILTLF